MDNRVMNSVGVALEYFGRIQDSVGAQLRSMVDGEFLGCAERMYGESLCNQGRLGEIGTMMNQCRDYGEQAGSMKNQQ